MSAITKKKLSIILIGITFVIVAVLVTTGFAVGIKKDCENGCVLKTYQNKVCIIVDGKIYKSYPEIVVSTLPTQDIKQLENGIAFSNIYEAQNAIEDYDG